MKKCGTNWNLFAKTPSLLRTLGTLNYSIPSHQGRLSLYWPYKGNFRSTLQWRKKEKRSKFNYFLILCCSIQILPAIWKKYLMKLQSKFLVEVQRIRTTSIRPMTRAKKFVCSITPAQIMNSCNQRVLKCMELTWNLIWKSNVGQEN